MQYYDLFSHKVIEAVNKLQTNPEIVRAYLQHSEDLSAKFLPKEQKEAYYREKAKHTECQCHHKQIINGVCSYRTCRHSDKEHW